jgi:hypothetical protein
MRLKGALVSVDSAGRGHEEPVPAAFRLQPCFDLSLRSRYGFEIEVFRHCRGQEAPTVPLYIRCIIELGHTEPWMIGSCMPTKLADLSGDLASQSKELSFTTVRRSLESQPTTCWTWSRSTIEQFDSGTGLQRSRHNILTPGGRMIRVLGVLKQKRQLTGGGAPGDCLAPWDDA